MIQVNKIGSALSFLGTTLAGVGMLFPGGEHANALWYVALAGFTIKACGSAFEMIVKQEDSK